MTADAPSRLQQLWLCEAIRLQEAQAAALDDEAINRQVRAEGGDLARRITARAVRLAQRDGQWPALQHWQQGAVLAAMVLMVLALASGFGLGVAALGDGQRAVNVFWALGTLLGVNTLLLFGWLLLQFAGSGSVTTLGRLWFWLSGKLARDARAAQLAPALLYLTRRQQSWAFGVAAHLLWVLVMLGALVALLALLATRRYDFVWETTILGHDLFVVITQGLAALPALFGFAVPEPALIRAAGEGLTLDEMARQRWASWLTGVVLVYGLLPRLLLLLCCSWCLWRGLQQLQLDLELPEYQSLAARLLPGSERIGVIDSEPAELFQPRAGCRGTDAGGALLIGVEIDPQRPWPPATLPDGVGDGGVVDSREQRRALLERLSRQPAQRLVIACDPRRSPDRGTLALCSELAGYAAAVRIWLLPPPVGEAVDSDRLDDWRDALARAALPVCGELPLRWLEQGDA